MSIIWNRFRGRNTSRLITTQGPEFKNARSAFVNNVEGAPTRDQFKIMLPLQGAVDDDSLTSPIFGAVAHAVAIPTYDEDFAATGVVTIVDEDIDLAPKAPHLALVALAQSVDDDLPFTPTTIVDEDSDGSQRAPHLALVAPVLDAADELGFVIDDDTNVLLAAPKSPTANLPNAGDDGDSTRILTDEEAVDVRIGATHLVSVPLTVDDEISFVVTDDADVQAPLVLRLVQPAALPEADDDISFVISDDADGTSLAAPRPATITIPVIDDDDATTPTLDDADSNDTVAPRALAVVLPDTADDEFAFPVEIDDEGHTLAAPLPLTALLPDTTADELAFAIEVEDDGRALVAPRASTAALPQAAEDEVATTVAPTLDDESVTQAVGRAVTAALPADQADELPKPTPPPPPSRVIGQPPRRRTGGGDWPQSNLYDPIEGDVHHPYWDHEAEEEATLAGLPTWAQLVHDILADRGVTVAVVGLDTRVVVDSLATQAVAKASAETGVSVGHPEIAISTSPLSVEVDIFDVVVTVDDGDADE